MISENLNFIKQHIAEIAQRCGRNSEDIRLLAVTKTFPVSAIKEALSSGQLIFGENYIQEAEKKYNDLNGHVQFHFIGHLQSNKAHIAAKIFTMIETVDSIKLASALNRHLAKLGKSMEILIQINIGQETTKSGVAPKDAEVLLRQIALLSNLHLRGLMTIPPFFDDPEKARPYFQELRSLSEALRRKELFYNNNIVELSMGMSGDYPVAIEEGATLIRVGTAIFGIRKHSA